MKIIIGPAAVLSANALLGDVTPAIAAAVGESDALKILLSSRRCGIRVAIGPVQPVQKYLDEAVCMLRKETGDLTE